MDRLPLLRDLSVMDVRRQLPVVLLASFLSVALLAGCGSERGDHSSVVGSADDLLPGESAEDWVTFADHLVSVHVVASEDVPMSEEEEEAGEGLIGRRLTMAVDHVFWSRNDAPELPTSLIWDAPGWSVKDGERSEFNIRGSPRIVAGHEYLIPVVLVPNNLVSGTGGWSPLSSSAVLAYDHQKIGNGPERIGPPAGPMWIDRFEGMTAEPAAAVLTSTKPAPETRGLMRESVMKRLHASQGREDGL